MYKRSYGACTHTGRVRDKNEDFYAADPDAGLWLVADGMGGRGSGEVASRVVAGAIVAAVRDHCTLAEAVVRGHRAVLDAIGSGKGAQGMGSTVVALRMLGNRYEIVWVGDSRAYVWGDGRLRQLSRDHSFVQKLLDAGLIDQQQARDHPDRNRLTQVLGTVYVDGKSANELSRTTGHLAPGELLLLCSDGLTGELDDDRIAALLGQCQDVQQAAEQLVQAALDGGGRDNVTVILVAGVE